MRKRISACSESPEALRDEGQGTGYRAQGTGHRVQLPEAWALGPTAQSPAGSRRSSVQRSSLELWALGVYRLQQPTASAGCSVAALQPAPCALRRCDLRPATGFFGVRCRQLGVRGHGPWAACEAGAASVDCWGCGLAETSEHACARARPGVWHDTRERGGLLRPNAPMHMPHSPVLRSPRVSGLRLSGLGSQYQV